jgi:hypothetical protein
MTTETVFSCGCVTRRKRTVCSRHGNQIIAVSGSKTINVGKGSKINNRLWLMTGKSLPMDKIESAFDLVIEGSTNVDFDDLKGANVAYLNARNLKVIRFILNNCPRVLIHTNIGIVARSVRDPEIINAMLPRRSRQK